MKEKTIAVAFFFTWIVICLGWFTFAVYQVAIPHDIEQSEPRSQQGHRP